jgi:predicted nucleic acid-binding protein
MGMVYFLDNDVILKLTTYRMLDEALDGLEIDRSDIRVLESARFVFGSKKTKKKYSEETLLFATEFVKKCPKIATQDSEEYRLLEKQIKNDIDPGEATLIAATFQESASLLATGDKRCLKALANTECLDFIHKGLQGRVICLEQIICKSIEIQGFEWVLEKVIPNLDCDATLRAAFGSGSKSQYETVLGTLNIYIQDLQTTSAGILSDL